MNQKKAKLINKYLAITGLKKTGYITKVRLPTPEGEKQRYHQCVHSDARAIKREYNLACDARKYEMSMQMKHFINQQPLKINKELNG